MDKVKTPKNEEKQKRSYQSPEMQPLEAMGNLGLVAAAAGDCSTGSSATSTCHTGNSASTTCGTGNSKAG